MAVLQITAANRWSKMKISRFVFRTILSVAAIPQAVAQYADIAPRAGAGGYLTPGGVGVGLVVAVVVFLAGVGFVAKLFQLSGGLIRRDSEAIRAGAVGMVEAIVAGAVFIACWLAASALLILALPSEGLALALGFVAAIALYFVVMTRLDALRKRLSCR